MFVDEITIHARAGKGGNGVVLWRHEKGKDHAGPSGGNGGKGGDVYAVAVRDLGLLSRYRNVKEFSAENGQNGMRSSKTGEAGGDIEIEFPIGSRITNLLTKRIVTLESEWQREILLHGGQGGLGNEYFKSSTNRRPDKATPGKEGEEADFYIELELVVDAGLIGLPNAGKSSLLNAITNAKAKIGSFPFTTIEPNLGDFYGYIIADIPGLIEGASQGKGLGDKFLRHIKRTKALFHCISLENEDIAQSYETIRKELGEYDKSLLQKSEVIILTKTDLVSKDSLEKSISILKEKNKKVLTVSVLDEDSLATLKAELSKILQG